jgi:YNFM family putative membrane transporter
MFASLYSTQAILPELSRAFDVSAAGAGLTVSAATVAIAATAWFWGPFSDRTGRVRAIRLACILLVGPTLLVAVAPSFAVLLVARVLQGACLPGLLVVGAPYVVEALVPRVGARAMGWYVGALVAGGLVGRVGVALATSLVGWRWACAAVTLLPLAALAAMRGLPESAPPARTRARLRNVVQLPLIAVTTVGCALFFAFVGTFTFITYRLEGPPFDVPLETASLVFLLWTIGLAAPVFGRIVERWGWRFGAALAVVLSALGVVVSRSGELAIVIPALACIAVATFFGYTSTQLAVADVAPVDRGTASAFYFSAYYASGALGAYVPGLAWERWGWAGIVASGLVALGIAAAALGVLLQRFEPVPMDDNTEPPYAL